MSGLCPQITQISQAFVKRKRPSVLSVPPWFVNPSGYPSSFQPGR